MSDQPLKRYVVALPVNVAAESPQEAIVAFIAQVNAYGLTTWNYSVVDEDGGEAVMVRLDSSEEDPEGDDEPVDEPAPEPSD